MRDDDETMGSLDPVTEFLHLPVVKNVKNPIVYWRSLMDSRSDPTWTAFAQMAIDFLSAPGKLCLLFFPILSGIRSLFDHR